MNKRYMLDDYRIVIRNIAVSPINIGVEEVFGVINTNLKTRGLSDVPTKRLYYYGLHPGKQ